MQQKLSLFVYTLIFSCITLLSCTQSSSEPTEEMILEEFTEVFYEFYETYKASDIAFVDYYAEDVISMDNTGEVEVGSEDYRAIYAELFEERTISKLDYTAPEIIFSRDMMFTYNDYDEEFTDNETGEITGVKGTWIAVWKKIDGEWKVVMNTYHLKE